MRIVVEPCHQDDTVDNHLPFLSHHELGLGPECTSADFLVARLLGFDELSGLWEAKTNELVRVSVCLYLITKREEHTPAAKLKAAPIQNTVT